MTTRRWRHDDLIDPARPADSRASGRRTVVLFVAGVLLLWFGLDRGFRAWKARYEARAAFAATRLAPAVDPMARLTPDGVDPVAWRRAVADTHAMLLALGGSGVLDEGRLEDLRRQVADRAARARPETAVGELSALWDDLERRAGPIIAPDRVPPPAGSRHALRHPRPPRPALLGPPVASRE